MRKISYKIKLIYIFLLLLNISPLFAQNSGSIWIKKFLPGSACLADRTIDQKALAFVDSLMKRDDIEVTFLGGADPTNWRLFGKKVKHQVSDTWDQAKKLERASILRQRYNRGQIGTTDEPFRGVKVVWMPKKPDIFKMNQRLGYTESKLDSLSALMDSLRFAQRPVENILQKQTRPEVKDPGRLICQTFTPSIVSDWEVTSGVMVWSCGKPYDLSVPYVGLAFKREHWAVEFQGGFTPWSQPQRDGNRGDALLFGSLHLFPKSWVRLKTGFFSGWEFLSDSDVWTMKIMGVTIGPKIRWKFLETYVGYSIGKLSSLTNEQWCSGGLITTSFHFKIF